MFGQILLDILKLQWDPYAVKIEWQKYILGSKLFFVSLNESKT